MTTYQHITTNATVKCIIHSISRLCIGGTHFIFFIPVPFDTLQQFHHVAVLVFVARHMVGLEDAAEFREDIDVCHRVRALGCDKESIEGEINCSCSHYACYFP